MDFKIIKNLKNEEREKLFKEILEKLGCNSFLFHQGVLNIKNKELGEEYTIEIKEENKIFEVGKCKSIKQG